MTPDRERFRTGTAMIASVLLSTLPCCVSAAQDAPLPVETLVHTYGPFVTKPNLLQQMPPGMRIVFPEDLWVVGYRTEIVGEKGQPLSRELQCHTFIGTSLPAHDSNDILEGLFTDGYTPGLDLPTGFGIPIRAGEALLWTPMFNNRGDWPVSAAMKLELKVVRNSGISRDLTPLTTTFRSVHKPDLYMAPPGISTQSTTFTLPAGHTIHVIGPHMHPYGLSIELINLRRGVTVWKAIGKRGSDEKLISMPLYSDSVGYAIRSGDRFELIARYDNPTGHPVDAMAGVFILYSDDADPAQRGEPTDKLPAASK